MTGRYSLRANRVRPRSGSLKQILSAKWKAARRVCSPRLMASVLVRGKPNLIGRPPGRTEVDVAALYYRTVCRSGERARESMFSSCTCLGSRPTATGLHCLSSHSGRQGDGKRRRLQRKPRNINCSTGPAQTATATATATATHRVSTGKAPLC